MQPTRRQGSGTVPIRILSKQKNRRSLSLRLRPRRTLPAAGLLKTVSGEVIEDAGAVVVGVATDAAMGAAMDAAKGVIAVRSRALLGLRARMFLLRLLLVPRNQDEASSLDRRRVTSRFCCPENRSPSIGDWRSHRCRSGILSTPELKRALPLRPSQSPRCLSGRLFQTMNPSLLVRLQLSKLRMSRTTAHDTLRKIARCRTRRRQLRWTGTANFAGRRWRA